MKYCLLAACLLLAQPLAVAAKVALQMRPAHLPAVGVQAAVAVPAVRDHDPRIGGADQRGELLAVAVLGDLQKRHRGSGRGPQRASLTPGAPARKGFLSERKELLDGVAAGDSLVPPPMAGPTAASGPEVEVW